VVCSSSVMAQPFGDLGGSTVLISNKRLNLPPRTQRRFATQRSDCCFYSSVMAQPFGVLCGSTVLISNKRLIYYREHRDASLHRYVLVVCSSSVMAQPFGVLGGSIVLISNKRLNLLPRSQRRFATQRNDYVVSFLPR